MDDNVNFDATDASETVDNEISPNDTTGTDDIPTRTHIQDTSSSDGNDDNTQTTREQNPKDADATEHKKVKTPFVKELYDFIEVFVFAVCSVLLVFTFLVRICVVSGPSMENTLYDGEILLVSNLFYEPDYGDIVIFHQTSESNSKYNELIVKRVIAKGGDVIDIDFSTWTVTVNGNIVEEGYITLKGFPLGSDYEYPLTVPEGHLFLMGDNRNNSADSRSDQIGFVDERRILGRVILRVTPMAKFGAVK